MSIQYNCHHLSNPSTPLSPSYASSSSSYFPLQELFFCEECDAVRCDSCVAFEVASYFCPNCTFDVPSANVRGDKNRCARNCFSCPICSTALAVQGSASTEGAGPSNAGPPYSLICPCCRWSSTEIGIEFEKSTGLAIQLQKMQAREDQAQPEYDSIKDPLESYISQNTPNPATPGRSIKQPTRHISALTAKAAQALHRQVPGLAAASARPFNTRDINKPEEKERANWDELGEYGVKESWRKMGMEKGQLDVEERRNMTEWNDLGERQISRAWLLEGKKSLVPERIPLNTKLTKRCPHPSCRHLLIQPDTKTTRLKIKMFASNYLPAIEIGRRRRKVEAGSVLMGDAEEQEKRRRERRKTSLGVIDGVEEPMDDPLRPGETYLYQIAFTNPLYDPIQIRLTASQSPSPSLMPTNHNLLVPTPHFLVNPLKDAWAYDEEDEDLDLDGVTEIGASDDASSLALTSNRGTMSAGKKSRMSILGTGSILGMREKERRKKDDVERKGNCTKVGLEVEILPDGKSDVEFDLEVRYTYRVDEGSASKNEKKPGKEEYKNFTFWIRINLGQIQPS